MVRWAGVAPASPASQAGAPLTEPFVAWASRPCLPNHGRDARATSTTRTAPKQWEQDSESHGEKPAYETGGGTARFLQMRAWEWPESHRHLLVFNETCRLAPPPSRKNWRGRQVTLLHRAVLETAALLVGHVREIPRGESGRHEKETAAQVTRRRKTSPTSVLNDRGLIVSGRRWNHPSEPENGRACRTRTGVKQFCGLPDRFSPNAREWWSRRDSHPHPAD